MADKPEFRSTTLEGAFLEAAFLLQKGEINHHLMGRDKSSTDNPNTIGIDESQVLKYINITIDTDQQRAIIVATIPVASAPNSFGGYLVAYQFIRNDELSYNPDPTMQFYTK